MRKEAMDKVALDISSVIEEAIKDMPDDKALSAVCNICLRLATYPLAHLDNEHRQKFMPEYKTLVHNAIDDFYRYLNKSEAN